MRLKINPLFFLFFPFLVFSQKTVSITVFDKVDRSPLKDIKILIDSEFVSTDEQGKFVIEEEKLPIELSINDFRYYPKNIKVNDTRNIEIELTNRGFILDDITINSSFYPKKLKNNNISTSVLDDIEFRKNEGEFLINSLNQINGIYSHSAGYNTNRITIRGMGSRSPYSTNKIKSYLNNIPLSNGVGEITLEDFGIDILEQVEINKGPNSSIYGSGLGGNIILKTSKNLDKTVKLKSIYKSYNTYQNSLSFSKRINNLDLLFNFEKIKSDGYRDNNSYDNSRVFGSLNYELNKNYDMKYYAIFALKRVIKHKDNLIKVNPYDSESFEESLRSALTHMITGEMRIPKKLSGISLRYLKNRISVPRDMPIISARLLRQSLNKIESISDNKDIDKLPLRHRYDQDPRNFTLNKL